MFNRRAIAGQIVQLKVNCTELNPLNIAGMNASSFHTGSGGKGMGMGLVARIVAAVLFLASYSVFADNICETNLNPNSRQSDARVLNARAFALRVNPEKLKNYIQHLNGEKPLWGGFLLEDRKTDENREVARQAIALTLRQFGHQPEFHVFKDGTNIVVEIPGRSLKNEVIEVGAHYDTVNSGADDNGAGVALVMHLADLLTTHPPERTVRLVFYDLEEDECQGSCHHASTHVQDPRKFIGALVADSLGFYPEELNPKVVVAEIGPHEFNLPLARELFYQVRRLPIDRGVQLSAEIERVDGEMADHGSYWKEKRPAILLARPYGKKFDTPHNHGKWDTTDNMNWEYYSQAARLFVELVGFAARVETGAAARNALEDAKKEDLNFAWETAAQTLPPTVLPNEPLEDPDDKDDDDRHKPDHDSTRYTEYEHEDAPVDRHGYFESLKDAMQSDGGTPPKEKKVEKVQPVRPPPPKAEPKKKKRSWFFGLLLGDED